MGGSGSDIPHGTRSYNVEYFNTIPMFLANWRYPVSNEHAQTRTITIPFCQHHEEPNSSKLHMELVAARLHASSSVGVIIQSLCTDVSRKQLPKDITIKVMECLHNCGCNSRLITTMTIFVYFFLKVHSSLLWNLFYY